MKNEKNVDATDDSLNKKKSKSEIPSRKIATAQLGIEVGANWQNNFNHIQVPASSGAALQQKSLRLKSLLQDSSQNSIDLKTNTNRLSLLNKEIDKQLSTLKSYLKLHYFGQSVDWDTIYSQYGLTSNNNAPNKTGYMLPKDNGLRQAAMDTLINKLQEANNPVANQVYGLNSWQNLQTQHRDLWAASQQYRSNSSNYSLQGDILVKEIKAELLNLRRTMSMVYNKTDFARQKRAIGFLKESL
jgi:hypothetical protein